MMPLLTLLWGGLSIEKNFFQPFLLEKAEHNFENQQIPFEKWTVFIAEGARFPPHLLPPTFAHGYVVWNDPTL